VFGETLSIDSVADRELVELLGDGIAQAPNGLSKQRVDLERSVELPVTDPYRTNVRELVTLPTSSLHIEKLDGFYRLHKVPFNGELLVVDWTEKHLDNAKGHDINEWLRWLNNNEVLGRKKGYWRIPDAYLYHAVAKVVYLALDQYCIEQSKLAREFADNIFKKSTLTCTAVAYSVKGSDTVFHDAGYEGESHVFCSVKGEDYCLNPGVILEDLLLRAVLGEGNTREVHHIYSTLIQSLKDDGVKVTGRMEGIAEELLGSVFAHREVALGGGRGFNINLSAAIISATFGVAVHRAEDFYQRTA
jgi:hypothetical protein